jgi:hypothetical protein
MDKIRSALQDIAGFINDEKIPKYKLERLYEFTDFLISHLVSDKDVKFHMNGENYVVVIKEGRLTYKKKQFIDVMITRRVTQK